MLIARWDSCLYGWACLPLMSVEGGASTTPVHRPIVERALQQHVLWTNVTHLFSQLRKKKKSCIYLCWLPLCQHTHRKARVWAVNHAFAITHRLTVEYSSVNTDSVWKPLIAQKCAACPNQLCWIHKNSLFCMTVVHNQQRDQRRNFPKEWGHEGNVTGFRCDTASSRCTASLCVLLVQLFQWTAGNACFFFFFLLLQELKNTCDRCQSRWVHENSQETDFCLVLEFFCIHFRCIIVWQMIIGCHFLIGWDLMHHN